MPAELLQMSVKIPMPKELNRKFDDFTYTRGYSKGALLRVFIEAITDPARGPQIEQIIQNRAPALGKARKLIKASADRTSEEGS